jgi:hypothetical protein
MNPKIKTDDDGKGLDGILLIAGMINMKASGFVCLGKNLEISAMFKMQNT